MPSTSPMDELGPSFGRVFFEGFVLCGFLVAGSSYYLSPGIQGTRWTHVPELVFPIMFVIYPVTQGVWSILVAALWKICGRKGGRGQAVTLLLPVIVWAVVLLWHLVTNPSSPQAHFRRYFGTELPADVQDVGVKVPYLSDPGAFVYFFRCSEESTQRLVQLLKAKEVPQEELVSVWLNWGRDPFCGYKDVPDPGSWNDPHQFVGREGKTGTGYLVLTNGLMTEVFVSRDPLATKTDEELGPEGVAEMNESL